MLLTRFLIKGKPDSVALVIAHNSEVGDNSNWDNVLADLRARGGSVLPVGPLDRAAIDAWFRSELGRLPTETELDGLEQTTHGRAHDLKLAIENKRDGGEEPPQRDYLGYYERARRCLSPEARAVAELLAVINRDTLVGEDLLAVAAESLGVGDLGSALDELRDQRLLKVEGPYLALSHSLAQKSLLQTINARRKERLGEAWFATVRGYDVAHLTAPQAAVVS